MDYVDDNDDIMFYLNLGNLNFIELYYNKIISNFHKYRDKYGRDFMIYFSRTYRKFFKIYEYKGDYEELSEEQYDILNNELTEPLCEYFISQQFENFNYKINHTKSNSIEVSYELKTNLTLPKQKSETTQNKYETTETTETTETIENNINKKYDDTSPLTDEFSDFKYICEKCNYQTNIKSSYNQHLKTSLHLTGKRKPRSDKITYECTICKFQTNNKTNFLNHKLNNHSTKEERKIHFKFYCDDCDFGVFVNSLMNKHLQSKKHKIKVGTYGDVEDNELKTNKFDDDNIHFDTNNLDNDNDNDNDTILCNYLENDDDTAKII